MSDSNRHNKAPRAGTRFSVREDQPVRPPPEPLGRSRIPFDEVGIGQRSVSRPAVATKEPPARKPLITAKPVADAAPELREPPLARAAADLQRARSFAEPPAARRPAYPPAGYGRPPRMLPAQPSAPLLAVIAAACLAILYLLWFQPAQTRISIFNGGRSAPAADLPPVNPADYPQLPTPPGQTSVIGPPTIGAAQIDAILAEYGSPAAGTGQAWVDLGLRYKIDPAYAVAFFIHESSAGTNQGWAGIKPDGSTTHNIGNIICAGYPTCFGRFRDYPSWETGIEDWYKLIAVEYIEGRGAHTIEQIIPIYAPSFENDVPRYVGAVNDLVRGWRAQAGRP